MSDGRRGVVITTVWVVEPAVTAYARDRWADRVQLLATLQPVEA